MWMCETLCPLFTVVLLPPHADFKDDERIRPSTIVSLIFLFFSLPVAVLIVARSGKPVPPSFKLTPHQEQLKQQGKWRWQDWTFAQHDPIPIMLWQTYRTMDLPAPAVVAQDTWFSINQGLHKKTYVFDDDDVRALARSFFGDAVAATVDSFPLGVMRADWWRYAVLYVHGGIYADVDTQCLRPIKEWLVGVHPAAAAGHAVVLCSVK
jgi:hypothetical protein